MRKGGSPSVFLTAILFLIASCSHKATSPDPINTGNVTSGVEVINWGEDFSAFWKEAAGKPFYRQLELWNTIIEGPHKRFYSDVVWRLGSSTDGDARKIKRLARIFSDYDKSAREIQTNFTKFDTNLKAEIIKFSRTFPSAEFKRPIMAVAAPTFNGKSDSYEDGGERHFLAFGIDTLTIRHDDPDVLYTHELFHLYHGEVSGIVDDGAGSSATLLDSLWAEGLATYVSRELNPSATLESVFLDPELAKVDETRLGEFAKAFLKVKDVAVHSKTHSEIYAEWFLMNHRPAASMPCRSGYFLGFHVARILRQEHELDEMTHWPFLEAKSRILDVLKRLEGSR